MKLGLIISVSLGLALSAMSGWAGNIEAGKNKSQSCVACHNEDGNSTVPMWPKIAGQYPDYFIKQLHAFQQGETGPRYNAQMQSIVDKLNDQDIADLAAFYASQVQTPGKAQAEWVTLGERLYRGGDISKGLTACIACHGPKGLGNELANFPRVSGQHAEYTLAQLQAFQNGTRHNDPNNIMQMIAQRMTDQEMQAVSDFIAGLH
jgi:cytochrome c553